MHMISLMFNTLQTEIYLLVIFLIQKDKHTGVKTKFESLQELGHLETC